jgi:hypothetical protein
MLSGVLGVVFTLAAASPSFAQGRGRNANQGIPPGQMPPAGMCRVWYDGVPPGRQPRATSCTEAERVASRDRNARVIYGSDNGYGNNGYYDRSGNYPYGSNDRYGNDRYGNRYPSSESNRYGTNSVAYDNGYRDGLEKGREDARDRNSFDPVRHSWYRSGNRGYNSRYGTRDDYKLVYRDGFEAGYQQAYRQNGGNYSSSRTNRGVQIPWPF